MAASDPFQFDYETVVGRSVTALVGVRDHQSAWEQVAIVLGDAAVSIQVDIDSDEVVADLVSNDGRRGTWEPIRGLDHFLGRQLGWAWVGRNYRGYADMITFSFSELRPDMTLLAEASVLKCLLLCPPLSV